MSKDYLDNNESLLKDMDNNLENFKYLFENLCLFQVQFLL